MQDAGFLMEYAIPVIVGICLCTGSIIKKTFPSPRVKRFIPLAMGIFGVILNIWMQDGFSPRILLGGLVSGLSSTGLHQIWKNLLCKKYGVCDSPDSTE